ncbi:MAG: CPBP family intramembrane metalloprotease [Verrucomicrobiaceae bacterium]|nr:MAG: CPBP family intramembrane metalloprotease [Verrucomicrobiaceae bacterium]
MTPAKRLASSGIFAHTFLQVKSNPVILRLLAYFSAVLLIACLLSPPLYWAGSALADNGVLPFLKGFPFHRYFSRSLQIAAIVMLWPAFRWIDIRRPGELGIEPNPLRWRDLAAGIAVALVPVLLLAAGCLSFEIYRLKKEIAFSGVLRILATAPVVAVLEEFLFRGVLLGLCLRAMKPAAAAIVSSAVFAIVHFMRVARPEAAIPVGWFSGFAQLPQAFSSAPPWPILGWGVLSLLLAGLILAFATCKTRSLFLPIGIHAGWVAGQQGLQLIAKFQIKPEGALLPWIGPNVVSGAVPTGLVPATIIFFSGVLAAVYLRHVRGSLRSS